MRATSQPNVGSRFTLTIPLLVRARSNSMDYSGAGVSEPSFALCLPVAPRCQGACCFRASTRCAWLRAALMLCFSQFAVFRHYCNALTLLVVVVACQTPQNASGIKQLSSPVAGSGGGGSGTSSVSSVAGGGGGGRKEAVPAPPASGFEFLHGPFGSVRSAVQVLTTARAWLCAVQLRCNWIASCLAIHGSLHHSSRSALCFC